MRKEIWFLETSSIRKNFGYSTAFQILNMITPIITAPYVSRVLGASGLGIQSYTVAIQMYFSLLVSLGTASYGARTIARQRNNKEQYSKTFWEIMLVKVLTSILCLSMWGILILLSDQYREFYVILTCGILATLFDISWFFEGLEQFKLTVIRNMIFKLLGVAAIFIFVKVKEDVGIYIGISAVSSLLASISLWLCLRSFLVKVSIKELNVFPHLRETIIYFVPTIATSVYTYLDKTLLGLITHSMVENGYYEQAEKIINMAKSVVFTSLNSVMSVRMSYLFSDNRIDEIHQRIENSINYIFFMGFGCVFGLMGVAEVFIPIFFGRGYEPVITLIYFFAPIIVIIGISNCLGAQYYTPIGKRAQSSKYLICGSVVNLVLNILLIPLLGCYGAAIASVLAELVITVLYVRFSDGYMTVTLLCKSAWKKALAGVFMFVFIRLIGNIQMQRILLLGIEVLFGTSVYVLLLVIIRDKWTIGLIDKMRQSFLDRLKRKENER